MRVARPAVLIRALCSVGMIVCHVAASNPELAAMCTAALAGRGAPVRPAQAALGGLSACVAKLGWVLKKQCGAQP